MKFYAIQFLPIIHKVYAIIMSMGGNFWYQWNEDIHSYKQWH